MKQNKITFSLFSIILGLISILYFNPAQAIPAFASKYEKSCSYCHTAWPQLNKRGRRYKEQGYRLPDEVGEDQSIAGYMELGTFPISTRLISRPVDKKSSGDFKLRALHEIELYVAGSVGKRWSAFFEIEAEDENDFSPDIPVGVLSFNLHPAFNIQAVLGDTFWADPYGFLSDNQRLTRGHVSVIDQRFGGADGDKGRLRSRRQSVNLTGRLFDRLFYFAGVGGVAGDSEGVNASNFQGRIAFDITDDIMIGAFGITGETNAHTVTSTTTDPDSGFLRETSTQFADREFRRYGMDFQADLPSEWGNTRFQGAFIHTEDDNAEGTLTEDNNAWSIQAFHTFKTKTGKPTWVPLIRYDHYEKNDGEDKYDEVSLNLSYYLKQNIRAYVEYFNQINVPDGKDDDDRITLQMELAF